MEPGCCLAASRQANASSFPSPLFLLSGVHLQQRMAWAGPGRRAAGMQSVSALRIPALHPCIPSLHCMPGAHHRKALPARHCLQGPHHSSTTPVHRLRATPRPARGHATQRDVLQHRSPCQTWRSVRLPPRSAAPAWRRCPPLLSQPAIGRRQREKLRGRAGALLCGGGSAAELPPLLALRRCTPPLVTWPLHKSVRQACWSHPLEAPCKGAAAAAAGKAWPRYPLSLLTKKPCCRNHSPRPADRHQLTTQPQAYHIDTPSTRTLLEHQTKRLRQLDCVAGTAGRDLGTRRTGAL